MSIADRLEGEGEVFEPNGDIALTRLVYHLTVSQWGRFEVDGRFARKWVGQKLTLHLETGEWLDFVFTSSAGDMQALGALRKER